MESVVERQYRDYTRYLKPLRLVSFTDIEMMQSLMQCVDPEEVASVAQLLGHRRGVVRITFKTSTGVERLEEAVQRHRLAIGDVPLGLVDDGGQFIIVTLDNVPHYIPDEQVEHEMSKYGAVAGCSKDYIEVRGCRIENERRNILFTAIMNKQAVMNSELDMFGTTVYAKAPYLDPDAPTDAASNVKDTNSAESRPRPHEPLQGSHPGVTKRVSGGNGRQPGIVKRTSMSQQFPTEPPEAHATPSAGITRGPGPTDIERPAAEKAHGRGGTASVHSRGGMDTSKQIAKRTEAFEQLSAFLQ